MQTLDLRLSNKHVAFRNFYIYYRWKNIKQQSKNNKLKITTPTRNDKFELLDGSYSASDIHDYVEYITKRYETLSTDPSFHININRINNRLVFKIKDGCKLELQKLKTMKLFDSTNKLIDKTKK